MLSNVLVQAFGQLHLRDQQQELKTFYESLSKQQIRDLRSLIETTEFRYDIVANLPFELIPLIFQHLDLYQCFQCRRVSQRWLEILSADQLVKSLLLPWTATENPELHIPDGSSTASVLAIKAEHQDAFQTGNAFSRVQIKHGQNLSDNVGLFRHAYAKGLLAWVDHSSGCDVIYLHDLENGYERTFTPIEREEIDEITLSTTLLVAMTTSAKCYIWAHGTSRPPYHLRIPSRCRNVFQLSEASFVLIQIKPNLTEPVSFERFGVMVWKLHPSWQDQAPNQPPQATVSQFFARFPSGASVMCWHDVTMDRTHQNVIIFESMVNTDKSTHAFRVLHLNVQGKVLFEGSIECPFSTNITWNIHENSLHQKQRFFEVWLVAGIKDSDLTAQQAESLQGTAVTQLRYFLDTKTIQTLEQKTLRHDHLLPAGAMMELFPWKGIAYFEEPCWEPPAEPTYNLRVMDFRKGTCTRASAVAPLGTIDSVVMFLGDEVFLAKVTSTHFVVWCFDKHLQMAGEDPDFVDKRRLALQERMKQLDMRKHCGS